jgi:hypothetical protein
MAGFQEVSGDAAADVAEADDADGEGHGQILQHRKKNPSP